MTSIDRSVSVPSRPLIVSFIRLPLISYSSFLPWKITVSFPFPPSIVLSQYYVDATLTGKRDSNLLGNDADNTFKGNSGDNTIDGGKGNDTVIFQGKKEEYEINGNLIKDTIKGRDGTDTLLSIEVIKFHAD